MAIEHTKSWNIRNRHGTDPGQVTGTGHRNGRPVPGDLGTGQNGYNGYLGGHNFDVKELGFMVNAGLSLTKIKEICYPFRNGLSSVNGP